MKEIAGIVEGRGGGKADMAEGGGKNPGRIDEAFSRLCELLGAE